MAALLSHTQLHTLLLDKTRWLFTARPGSTAWGGDRTGPAAESRTRRTPLAVLPRRSSPAHTVRVQSSLRAVVAQPSPSAQREGSRARSRGGKQRGDTEDSRQGDAAASPGSQEHRAGCTSPRKQARTLQSGPEQQPREGEAGEPQPARSASAEAAEPRHTLQQAGDSQVLPKRKRGRPSKQEAAARAAAQQQQQQQRGQPEQQLPQQPNAKAQPQPQPQPSGLTHPKQLTALIRHSHGLEQVSRVLQQHCGISDSPLALKEGVPANSRAGVGKQAAGASKTAGGKKTVLPGHLPSALDGVAVSAALHRLASICNTKSSVASSSSSSSSSSASELGGEAAAAAQAGSLAEALLETAVAYELLEDMQWRELSSVLWSAARLGLQAPQDVLHSVHHGVEPMLCPPHWLPLILQRMSGLGFHGADAQALNNTAWALPKLSCLPHVSWLQQFLQAVQASLPQLQAQHLTNIIHALARLHVLQGVYGAGSARQGSAAEQQGVLAPAGLHKQGHSTVLPPPAEWMASFLHEAFQAMPSHTPGAQASPAFTFTNPQQYSNLLYSLAVLECPPPDDAWRARFWAASVAALRKSPALHHLHPRAHSDDTPTSSIAGLQQSAQQQHQQHQHKKHQHEQQPASTAVTLQQWQHQRQLTTSLPPQALHPQHLSNMLWAAGRLHAAASMRLPPAWWLRTVEARAMELAHLLSPQELSNIIYAYGLMSRRPVSPGLLPLLFSWTMQHAEWGLISPQTAANILWGAARIHLAMGLRVVPCSAAPRRSRHMLIDSTWLQRFLDRGLDAWGGGCDGAQRKGLVRERVGVGLNGQGTHGHGSTSTRMGGQGQRGREGQGGGVADGSGLGDGGSLNEAGLSVHAVASILWGAAIMGLDPGRDAVRAMLLAVAAEYRARSTAAQQQHQLQQQKQDGMEGAGEVSGPRDSESEHDASGGFVGEARAASTARLLRSRVAGADRKGSEDGVCLGDEESLTVDSTMQREGPGERQIRWALRMLGYR